MESLLKEYCQWQRVWNYSEGTIRNGELYIGQFIGWLAERSVLNASEVTKPMLERYQRVLFTYRKKDGQPLSIAGQHVRLTTIQGFFKWQCRHNYLLANPPADLELPKIGQRLPKAILTANEAERILNLADLGSSIGLRDRAILETLYATGIRRKELASLKLYDVDVERGTVLVRQGKGKKDRLLPLGERAAVWVGKYVEDARPEIVIEPDGRDLFLNNTGTSMRPATLGNLVHGYIQQSDIGKSGSCHLFRHAMATLMLENGADIRYMQEMLGHARLDTTQIYPHVNIQKLMEVHQLTHPAKLAERRLQR